MFLSHADGLKSMDSNGYSDPYVKLTLSGTVAAVPEAELDMAVKAVEKRHPGLPWDKEEWAIVELEVEEGFLVDIYGGAHLITPDLYYSTAPKRPHLPWCPHLPLGLHLPWCRHAHTPSTPPAALTLRPRLIQVELERSGRRSLPSRSRRSTSGGQF